jgi:hypothetical protein
MFSASFIANPQVFTVKSATKWDDPHVVGVNRISTVRFSSDNGYSHFWQAPAGSRACYALLVELATMPSREASCLANDHAIAYSVDAQAAFSVLIHYRNARFETRGTACDALPGERETTASPKPPPAAANGGDAPAFAWPPPRPTTRRTLARHLVAGDAATPTLGQVADRLQAALESGGYVEYSYYSLRPGGFALATRLERIHPDGRSMDAPKRWEIASGPLTRFELGEYLRALFDAERGHFRVIVFIVTPAALATGAEPPSAAAALNWPLDGVPVLPDALRRLTYDSAFETHALIYEFETRGQGQPAVFKTSSSITGDAHLRRAKLMGALER